MCKFPLYFRRAGALKTAFQKNTPLIPKLHLLEENKEVEQSGTSLLQVGDEGQGHQVVDEMTVPQPRDGVGEGNWEQRFSGFVLGWAGSQGLWGGTHSPVLGKTEGCCFSGVWGREEGLALAALKHSTAQKEFFCGHKQSRKILPLALSPRFHPRELPVNVLDMLQAWVGDSNMERISTFL